MSEVSKDRDMPWIVHPASTEALVVRAAAVTVNEGQPALVKAVNDGERGADRILHAAYVAEMGARLALAGVINEQQ